MVRALKFLVWILKKNGFDAFVPKEELREAHMDIHVAARSKDEARAIAKKLVSLYGLKIKKRHDNGTHILFMPHLIAVLVNPDRD